MVNPKGRSVVSCLFWLFWHASEIFLCCLYMTNNDMITIHFLKGNIIEIMGKIIFHISMKFWVTLTHIFQGQFFFLPKKINFRGLCTKLCNDICTDNTSDSCRKHLAFRKCILLALFSNYYKAGGLFHPQKCCFSPMHEKRYISLLFSKTGNSMWKLRKRPPNHYFIIPSLFQEGFVKKKFI